MGRHVSLLADLKAGKPCTQEAIAAIEGLESELEALRERVRATEDAQCEVCGAVMPLHDNPPG